MTVSEDRYGNANKVVIRTIGDDILLVPVGGSAAGVRVYPLNETAEVVWRCLSTGGSVPEAADALVALFDVSKVQALADSQECADVFLDELLIERVA